jgi:FkbM family methyltransferase
MNLQLLKRIIRNKVTVWLSYVKLIPITRKLDHTSVVLDCGANVGDITRRFANTGALVHAFEPDPVAFDILRRKFSQQSNVILYNKGVWDHDTQLVLYSHKDQPGTKKKSAFTVSSSIIESKVNIDREKGQTIEVIDLSAFIKNLGRHINVIKLDVEGAETAILKKILLDGTYIFFDAMYVETHESKIPGQTAEIEEIKKIMSEKDVKNIRLNWL